VSSTGSASSIGSWNLLLGRLAASRNENATVRPVISMLILNDFYSRRQIIHERLVQSMPICAFCMALLTSRAQLPRSRRLSYCNPFLPDATERLALLKLREEEAMWSLRSPIPKDTGQHRQNPAPPTGSAGWVARSVEAGPHGLAPGTGIMQTACCTGCHRYRVIFGVGLTRRSRQAAGRWAALGS
jgi:hypothetical protein